MVSRSKEVKRGIEDLGIWGCGVDDFNGSSYSRPPFQNIMAVLFKTLRVQISVSSR